MIATHPKIVELFGLPGCGKTTLRDNLIQSSESDRKYSLMTELTRQFKGLSLYSKFRYIPWRIWWKLFRFLLSMPLLPIKEWVYYRVFFSSALIYHYSNFAISSSIIINDHGFVQAVVSLMNGHIGELSEHQCKKLIEAMQLLPCVLLVYCWVPKDVAFQRIRTRNRDVGRLDVIKDDRLLNEYLQVEEDVFTFLSERLKNVATPKCYVLECNQDATMCAANLKELIKL